MLKVKITSCSVHAVTEGKVSVASKIVLKCWLDEKLDTDNIETRVPISLIGDTNRKYEFSFLSRAKNIAFSYCHDRVNLSDEKFEILEGNRQNIHIIFVIDAANGGCDGQYPEALMKIQDRQGYCLLLEVENISYNSAVMYAVFYAQDIDGFWKEIEITKGHLRDYDIDDECQIIYSNKTLERLKNDRLKAFDRAMQAERMRRKEEERLREEEQQRLFEEAERQEETKRREEDFKRNMAANFSQQETPIRDASDTRWIKCEFCGLIAKDSEFVSYGGVNHVNLGTCKSCSEKRTQAKITMAQQENEGKPKQNRYDASICPECGGKLRERSGRYGNFMGCSNYPECRFVRKITAHRPSKNGSDN